MMEWQPIETAPDLERVIVAGWCPKSGNVRGYWWYSEDATDDRGVPIDHPYATLFARLADVIPAFPAAPTPVGAA